MAGRSALIRLPCLPNLPSLTALALFNWGGIVFVFYSIGVKFRRTSKVYPVELLRRSTRRDSTGAYLTGVAKTLHVLVCCSQVLFKKISKKLSYPKTGHQ